MANSFVSRRLPALLFRTFLLVCTHALPLDASASGHAGQAEEARVQAHMRMSAPASSTMRPRMAAAGSVRVTRPTPSPA